MSTHIETNIAVSFENRNRQTVFFRWIIVAPVVVFVSLFAQLAHWGFSSVLLTAPVAVALLIRGVYPSYALSFNHALMELSTRVAAYALLLTDEFPSIERNPNISVIFPDVEGGKKLSRGLPLIKWFFAIPLYIVGAIYLLLSAVLTIFAWISTAVSGTYPEWAANTVLGTLKYWNRVLGYSVALVSDEYPPFTL
jgi:multisubunit Na+/H+ antiporter MnhG subunit